METQKLTEQNVINNETQNLKAMKTANKHQAKISKLEEKIATLETKLFNESCRENELLNRRGWGYGMRHSKIGFSTTKSDSLRNRIAKAENELKMLIESK